MAAAHGEREITALTREELYDRVWSEAMANLAPQLGLSDVGLKKICKRMRVPTPYRGYWARKEAGQKPKRTALPNLPASVPASMLKVEFRRQPKTGSDTPELAGPVGDQARYEAVVEHRIVVREMLSDPHPLVAMSVRLLRKAKAGTDHLLAMSDRRCLDLSVTLGTVDRALCIYDALLKAVESRGYVIGLNERDGVVSTTVSIGDELVSIAIDERVDRVERRPDPRPAKSPLMHRNPEFDYVPTGRLSLRILEGNLGVRRAWGDHTKQRVEACLNDFIVGLVAASETMRVQRLELEARRRQWEEAARERQLAEECRLAEAARVRALEADMADWGKSQAIREYVQAMWAAAERAGVGEPGSPLARWLTWAEEYAQGLDPAAQTPEVPRDPHGGRWSTFADNMSQAGGVS